MERNEPSEERIDTGTGYLSLSVRTADGAIPLAGALVTLRQGSTARENGGENDGSSDGSTDGENSGAGAGGGGGAGAGAIIAAFLTDRSGMTPRVYLPAPPRAASQAPGGTPPYALYAVEVSLPGYYTNAYAEIPVFDGITSVQTVTLVPLPEGTAEGSVIGFGGGREEILSDDDPARKGADGARESGEGNG